MKQKYNNKHQLDKFEFEDDEDVMTPEEKLVLYIKKLAEQKEIENYLKAFELTHKYALVDYEIAWIRAHFPLHYAKSSKKPTNNFTNTEKHNNVNNKPRKQNRQRDSIKNGDHTAFEET